jgi:Flp pilus assembly protein TadG
VSVSAGSRQERCRNRLSGDGGSAIVEMTFLGTLLLVPLVYALLTAFDVQRSAYAVTAAARDAGRAAVSADSWSEGQQDARAAAEVALEGAGIDPASVVVTTECRADPCLTAGGAVEITLATRVPLPWVPPFVDAPPSIAITAQHSAPVDRFREERS